MAKSTIHYIYKIHFLCGYPTGRYYLGKRTYHGLDLQNDKYHGSGNFCKAYFKKYGAIYGETYIKEIIEINPSYEINKFREKLIIGDKWSTDPLCMNVRGGGDGGYIPGHKLNPETIQKLKNINSKPVSQISLDGETINIFPSIQKASDETGVCRSKIVSCCNNKRLTAGGYIWKHLDYELTKDELKKINKYNKKRRSQKEKVICIDVVTGKETIYNSLREAERKMNISNSSISEVCKGKRKTAGGYKWKYVND